MAAINRVTAAVAALEADQARVAQVVQETRDEILRLKDLIANGSNVTEAQLAALADRLEAVDVGIDAVTDP